MSLRIESVAVPGTCGGDVCSVCCDARGLCQSMADIMRVAMTPGTESDHDGAPAEAMPRLSR
eukprot:3266838-Rhodomonas_salina.3